MSDTNDKKFVIGRLGAFAIFYGFHETAVGLILQRLNAEGPMINTVYAGRIGKELG
jgi:hypothetical protein